MTLLTPKLTMQVFGLYLVIVAGLGLMLIPHVILGLFGMSSADEAWIRTIGMLASLIGANYLLAAKGDVVPVFRWSVPLRLYAASFMVVLFVVGMVPAGILIFAGVDAAGALWTWAALRARTQG